jgi:hypothetical protein
MAKSYEQRAAEADSASRAALKQLKREQEHAEALAEARAALASVNGAGDLERLSGDLDEMKRLDPEAFLQMRARVIDSLPSAQKMHVKAQDQLAHPRQYGPPEPPTAEQLAAAVATGSIDLATFGRLSNEQAAMLKREHKALYWDAANALAATAERPYSVVGR